MAVVDDEEHGSFSRRRVQQVRQRRAEGERAGSLLECVCEGGPHQELVQATEVAGDRTQEVREHDQRIRSLRLDSRHGQSQPSVGSSDDVATEARLPGSRFPLHDEHRRRARNGGLEHLMDERARLHRSMVRAGHDSPTSVTRSVVRDDEGSWP